MTHSWKDPPPAVVITGNENFLREREIRKAVFQTAKLGRDIIWAESDDDVIDGLSAASTFGKGALIIVPAKSVLPETVKEVIEDRIPEVCLLLTHTGGISDKGMEAAAEVNGAFQVQFMIPTGKKALRELAQRFIRVESDRIIGKKKTLDKNLADAIVRAVGTDIGTLSYEILKIATLARAKNLDRVTADHVRALIRPSTGTDLDPLREAIRTRNGPKIAKEMDRIRRNSARDPLMLILRSKGGVSVPMDALS